MPLQQSLLLAHESVFWMQNDPPLEHVPLRQAFEQQSAWFMHVLPVVRHAVLRGVHVPDALQVPLQH
jgi:hypothetical protein